MGSRASLRGGAFPGVCRPWSPQSCVQLFQLQTSPEALTWCFAHSPCLPHWGQPLSWSSSPLLGCSFTGVPDVEIDNDYISNTWKCLYSKHLNILDKGKALLASSASCHTTVLPEITGDQFDMCPCLIPVSPQNMKFCEHSATTGLLAVLSGMSSKTPSDRERPRSPPWMICGPVVGRFVSTFANCQTNVIKVVICFKV